MSSETPSRKPAKRSAPATEDVNTFLATLDHPHKQEILAVREIILSAHPSITDGVKWNAPSFRTTEWFATFHLRAKDGVQVILHFGAKVKDKSGARAAIADSDGLLEWLGPDRASVRFRDAAAVAAQGEAFAGVIRQWIAHV